MTKVQIIFLTIVFFLVSSCSDSSWKPLFDGISTNGWRGLNQDHFPEHGWKVENGMLIRYVEDGKESQGGGDIITVKQYGNFDFKWEWKLLTEGGNSGVKYFVVEALSNNPINGIGLEYQIFDDGMLQGKMKDGDYHALAALYEIYPPGDRKVNPPGQWNTSRILSHNNQVEHWLNGNKVLEYERGSEDFNMRVAQSKFKNIPDFGLAAKGHILLQDHGSPIAFRNLQIREF
jgi:hypothetical protein